VPLVSLLSAAVLLPALAAGTIATAAPAAAKAGRGPRSAAAASLASLASATRSVPVAGRAFPGMPQFGELVWQNPDGTPGTRLCTAVAVDSAGGDLIATAAHCVDGVKSKIGGPMTVAYLPGAEGADRPYGVWYPTRIIRPQQWMNGLKNPDFDVAFLTVAQPGTAGTLASFTGSEHFGTIPPAGALGVQIGYPDTSPGPIVCRSALRFHSPTQLELDCAGFAGGSSGGPVLTGVDPGDGVGTLVGVLGGYQRGGEHDDVSYASAFTPAITRLYRQAARF
jgi:Trypsin-like peptidase domain